MQAKSPPTRISTKNLWLRNPTNISETEHLARRGRDAQGNYVALGFGLEACQTFLQARSNGLDMPYRHWLTGYLTAVNKLTNNTVDIRGTTDTDGMLGLLEQYCIKHPLHSFSSAVEFLASELYPKRLTHMPHAPAP